MKKRMISFLIVLLLLVCLPIAAFAHEVPDLNEKGFIEITMTKGNETVSGGELVCTRVGYIDEEDGNYFFRRLDGEQVVDIASQDVAQEMVEFLKDYQKIYSIKTEEKAIGKDGKVKFNDLETGLYLIMQENPPEGYYAISSFLVGIPNNEDGHYVYDIAIHSKTEPEREPEPTKPTPSKPTDLKLPQTGQLIWPILVLTAAGLLLVVVGFVLRRGKNNHEA